MSDLNESLALSEGSFALSRGAYVSYHANHRVPAGEWFYISEGSLGMFSQAALATTRNSSSIVAWKDWRKACED